MEPVKYIMEPEVLHASSFIYIYIFFDVFVRLTLYFLNRHF